MQRPGPDAAALIAAQRFGLGSLLLGVVLTVAGLTDVLAMYGAGVLADRIGWLPTMTLGISLGVLGAMIAFHAVDVGSLGQYLAASALLGTAVGTGWFVRSLSAVDPASSLEAGLSAYRIAADIGMGLGAVAMGWIAAAHGIGGALAGVITVLIGITVLTAFIGETMPRKQDTHRQVSQRVTRELRERTDMEDLQQQVVVEHFRQMALDQGFTLGQVRLEVAAASHRAMRPALEKLRQVPLAFVGDVIEPSTARGWLESGGIDQ